MKQESPKITPQKSKETTNQSTLFQNLEALNPKDSANFFSRGKKVTTAEAITKKTTKRAAALGKTANNALTSQSVQTSTSLSKPDSEKKPATDLMKAVARKAPSPKNMKKVFTKEEIDEIIDRKEIGDQLDPEEKLAIKEQYRKIKRQVKEMEKGNQSRVIVFPSLTSGQGWYKVLDFSALYYVYRLADRMGRGARILKDSDNFSRGVYAASFQNIEKFIEQFNRLEQPDLEITDDGVYIFTLKNPVSDDELGALRRTEETRRDKLHNIMRPKAMDPATFQAILLVVRQVTPRVRKLEKQYYHTTGEQMVKNIQNLLAIYFDFADGIYERREAGWKLLSLINHLNAGVTLLSEIRVWPYDVASVIGENINEIKRLVVKDFNLRSAPSKKSVQKPTNLQ